MCDFTIYITSLPKAFFHTHCMNSKSSYNRIRKTTIHLFILREWVAFMVQGLGSPLGKIGPKSPTKKFAKSVNQELNNTTYYNSDVWCDELKHFGTNTDWETLNKHLTCSSLQSSCTHLCHVPRVQQQWWILTGIITRKGKAINTILHLHVYYTCSFGWEAVWNRIQFFFWNEVRVNEFACYMKTTWVSLKIIVQN